MAWWHLRQFPGPALAHCSYLWIIRAMFSGRMPSIMTAAQAKYGPIIRIGPNDLLICSADEFRRMNTLRSRYTRGGWYQTMKLDPDGHSIFSEPDTAKHDKRKAILAGGFAGRGDMNLEADVDSQVAIFVDLLSNKYISNKEDTKLCDMSQLARWFTIDVTTLSGLGRPWGDLEHERDTYNYLAGNDAFLPFAFTISTAAPLRAFFTSDSFLRFAAPKPGDNTGTGRFLSLARQIVEDRFHDLETGAKKQRHDNMVDTWLKNGHTKFDTYMDIGLLLNAGAETTTTVLRSIFMHTTSTPTVYNKLKGELRMSIAEKRISNPVTFGEAKQLPYLQAVIFESIRLLPPGIIGFAKRVPPEGDVLCGRFVPGGTDVFINSIDFMRDKAVFGEDADVFRPDRFLDCEEECKILREKHMDLIFGTGRWMCPGKYLAQMELSKLVVELFRRFDFQVANPAQPWKIQGYVTWVITDFFVRVTEGNLG